MTELNQDETIEELLAQPDLTSADINELRERNKVLLEALRKVKLLVERLLVQNREFKKKVETLEEEFKEQNKKGVKVVSATRYKEMQNNATELARGLPKLIKLIKLLNQENKLFKEKYSALETEFEDLINERDDLKEKIILLNEQTQDEVLTELTELFPGDELAAKVAKKAAKATDGAESITSTEVKVTGDSIPSFEDQARSDLHAVAGFSNEQISKLVDLVMEINEKIENLSGSMVLAAPARRRGKLDLDLSEAVIDGDFERSDEPPERPDLEEVLDDILISG
ncbi:MAG: hypothetical protein ACXABK_05760 [Candidatus Heimdallarchaeaceae archaeon]|jgi:hypothetical protein